MVVAIGGGVGVSQADLWAPAAPPGEEEEGPRAVTFLGEVLGVCPCSWLEGQDRHAVLIVMTVVVPVAEVARCIYPPEARL